MNHDANWHEKRTALSEREPTAFMLFREVSAYTTASRKFNKSGICGYFALFCPFKNTEIHLPEPLEGVWRMWLLAPASTAVTTCA